jgi:D-alanyl-D-alanine carboxypeptidase
MFSLLLAITLYLAFAPVQPALSVTDFRADANSAGLVPSDLRPAGPPSPAAPRKKDEGRFGIETSANSAVVIDWASGATLFEKNAASPASIASITKLVTALAVLDLNPNWGGDVVMIAADERYGEASVLRPGDKVKVRDLFSMSLIASSNNATAALARSTGLTEDEFIDKMNAVAKSIGMTESNFVEPTGLDSGNRASARDVALLIRRALSETDIQGTLKSREYRLIDDEAGRKVRNTDQLLGGFLDQPPYSFLGGKTGYIREAGYCFGAGAEMDGHRVVAVVLGTPGREDRFREAKNLIFWTFDAYEWPARAK